MANFALTGLFNKFYGVVIRKGDLLMNLSYRKKLKDLSSLLLFIAPFTVLYIIFLLFPLVQGAFYSFTDWNGISSNVRFIGLANYIEAFTNDKRFINSLIVTGKYTVATVLISNVVGLGLALFIENSVKIKSMLRTLFFVPYIFSLVVVGFSWKFIYTKIATNIYQLTNIGFFNLDFLGSHKIALISVIFMSVWHGMGYYMLIYIAGIQSIDQYILEAATIDGASGWKKFRYIKFPLLMPSVTICVFTCLAGSLKVFESIFVLTSGGPGYATETIAVNIYNEAFGSANLYGYGTAKAVVLALIIMVVSFIQLSYFKSKEVEA